MSLQSIWNYASKITINRRKTVGIQYTRSRIPLTDLSVNMNPWIFTLEFPTQPWNQMRGLIESLDNLDTYQAANVVVGNNTKFAWLYRYQGDGTSIPTGFQVDSFTGNTLNIKSISGFTSGQYIFRAGDLIQIDTKPYLYTIVYDVISSGLSTAVATTSRPNIGGSSANLSINVGPNCVVSLFCPNMPTYTLEPGATRWLGNTRINNAMVTFDSEFQLYEWLPK